jgi:hypothetical protein
LAIITKKHAGLEAARLKLMFSNIPEKWSWRSGIVLMGISHCVVGISPGAVRTIKLSSSGI